jgi:hypothetical protein
MKSDFEHWLVHHGKAYPGFAEWIESHPDQIDHLRRLLARYTRQQLEAATDALYEQDTQPNGYSHHGRAIRRLIVESSGAGYQAAVQRGPQHLGDELVAACIRCMDFGLVEVLSPATIKRLAANDPSRGLMTCLLACSCGLGERESKIHRIPRWQDGHMLIRYEDVLDLHCSSHRAEWEIAHEMFLEAHDRRQPQMHEEFSAWS